VKTDAGSGLIGNARRRFDPELKLTAFEDHLGGLEQ
jgi:hypothetical protein